MVEDHGLLEHRNKIVLDNTNNIYNQNFQKFDSNLVSLNSFDDETFYNDDLSLNSNPVYLDSDTSSIGTSSSPEPLRSKKFDFNQILNDADSDVYDISHLGSVASFISSRINEGHEEGSFLVTNLSPIIGQCEQWFQELPMVEPFYAMKCNPDPVTLRLLASMGCGFDCATKGEMEMVLNGLGKELSFGPRNIASTSIIYSHPAKMISHTEFALSNNIRMTVFDGEDELYKLASLPGHENFQLLMRIATDDKHSICRFSKKFGCNVREAPHLLEVARSLGLTVIGVSFHVGSGCGDGNAYVTALSHARWIFDVADEMNLPPMHMVDIGGGFPGDSGGYGGPGMPTFQDLAASIRHGIALFAESFPRSMDTVRFIAEPGRYFVSAATTIVTQVYSRKGGNNPYQALYVDNGVYGSFNNVIYDHATPVPQKLSIVLESESMLKKNLSIVVKDHNALMLEEPEAHLLAPSNEDINATMPVYESIPTAIFGPTCDGLDQMCSLESTLLPRCDIGDWLVWENQGAYTHTASFVFNGFTHIPKRTYCIL